MRSTLFTLTLASLIFLSACNKDRDCDRADAPAPAATPAKTPAYAAIVGPWKGRWESGKQKGHGGGLACAAVEAGPDEWSATFTAEFGKIKDYKIQLKGKPDASGSAVVFGGKVDLGKDDGGVFTWTGRATMAEFSGEYEGGGDRGTFKMTAVSPAPTRRRYNGL